MFLRHIHILALISNCFFVFLNNVLAFDYIMFYFCYVGELFQILSIMNNAVQNIYVPFCEHVLIFLQDIPRNSRG